MRLSVEARVNVGPSRRGLLQQKQCQAGRRRGEEGEEKQERKESGTWLIVASKEGRRVRANALLKVPLLSVERVWPANVSARRE